MTDDLIERTRALAKRFDYLRNSGVCSPTTRALLDDAQCLIAELIDPLLEAGGRDDS